MKVTSARTQTLVRPGEGVQIKEPDQRSKQSGTLQRPKLTCFCLGGGLHPEEMRRCSEEAQTSRNHADEPRREPCEGEPDLCLGRNTEAIGFNNDLTV